MSDALQAEIAILKKRLQDLEFLRDREYDRMLAWRGIYTDVGDKPCGRCGGAGRCAYASTATWRGGCGGQAVTSDVCDQCWGSGNAKKPWLNLRTIEKK